MISINYENSSNEHIICICDDGPGIPPDLQDKAIEMFHTLKSRDEIEGSGLGLSIVKKAAEQFNAKLELISDGKHGTCCELRWSEIS